VRALAKVLVDQVTSQGRQAMKASATVLVDQVGIQEEMDQAALREEEAADQAAREPA